ncbi:non-specific lipid transfer protein GPI-anchored 14-like [Impatiens glandulifera]|uniref:non-specific lipid transfer protein GPI-anchored 14-like n=1 Tax=Impatiens glandulifera TaxID=253017 RepID=UPI001FB07EA8|nr:non-specific lipid transfer protein GPI-anchored 14-like [Impatiens glandulifera]
MDSKLGFIILLLLLPLTNPVNGDTNKDLAECGQSLISLSTCLPFVSDKAKVPTPDCCTGLKQLLKNDKKCLCVIVEDRNDPQLGLTINVTSALQLPMLCKAPANVSQCPELLGMDPKSDEAQVFYQLGKKNSGGSVSSPALSPAGPATAPAPLAGNATTKGKNGNGVDGNGGKMNSVLFGGIFRY